jgi:hypothetical protein
MDPLFARTAFDAADWTVRGSAIYGREWIEPEEQEQQVLLLREVFGNPFRPVARLGPPSQAVTGLAREAYEGRAFELLPLLADALEDAGCDDPELLAHCRGLGPHVLGCWTLDLVSGQLVGKG